MAVNVEFDRDEERRLLTELFETVRFDLPSQGIPPLDPELDDEDDAVTAKDRALSLSSKARGSGWITHPRETARLHAYWVRGEGLAKWKNKPHPWTTLYRHLLKHIHNPDNAKRTAASWFHEVFGYWPGSDLHRTARGKRPRGQQLGPG